MNKETIKESSDLDRINEELVRREELINQNTGIQAINKDIDQYVELKRKIQNHEWLDEDDLRSLDIGDEKLIEDYLSTKEMMENEFSISDEQRTAEFLKNQNDEIEKRNKEIEKIAHIEYEKQIVKELDNYLDIISKKIDYIISLKPKFSTIYWDNDTRFFRSVFSKIYESRNIKSEQSLEQFFEPYGLGFHNSHMGESEAIKIAKSLTKNFREKVIASSMTMEEIHNQLQDSMERFNNELDSYIELQKDRSIERQKIQDRTERNSDQNALEDVRKSLKSDDIDNKI